MSKKDQNISKHADFLKGELTDYLSNPLLMFKKWYQEKGIIKWSQTVILKNGLKKIS